MSIHVKILTKKLGPLQEPFQENPFFMEFI